MQGAEHRAHAPFGEQLFENRYLNALAPPERPYRATHRPRGSSHAQRKGGVSPTARKVRERSYHGSESKDVRVLMNGTNGLHIPLTAVLIFRCAV